MPSAAVQQPVDRTPPQAAAALQDALSPAAASAPAALPAGASDPAAPAEAAVSDWSGEVAAPQPSQAQVPDPQLAAQSALQQLPAGTSQAQRLLMLCHLLLQARLCRTSPALVHLSRRPDPVFSRQR